MPDLDLSDDLRDETRRAWHRYLDRVEPIRPALHRYCRRLTPSVFDAEDLVQDTLLRGFARLAETHDRIRHPRAYLLRIATHLWIDRSRASTREPADAVRVDAAATAPQAETTAAVRDAGAALLAHLAPRERAALVLKEVFGCSLEETASILGSSVGAVKSALHRGRTRLGGDGDHASARTLRRRPVSVALVDRFVAAFNAGDRPAMVALLLEHPSSRVFGAGVSHDEDVTGPRGWLSGAEGHPEWPEDARHERGRAERRIFEGEPVVLLLRSREGREALEEVWRLEEEDGRVASLLDYGFCPETVAEIGAAFGLPVRRGPYRFPTPEPGRYHGRANDSDTAPQERVDAS